MTASDRRRAQADPGTGGVNRLPRRASGQGMWVVQRVTAMVLAVAVTVHLVTIIVAVRGGVSAAEIIGRTSGNAAWLGFYTLFALAAGLHGAIGLRGIAAEWLGWRGRGFDALWLALGLLTAGFGIRAALGLYAA
jgi:fumarate reductase subunit C